VWPGRDRSVHAVSVILPTYERRELVSEAVQSVLNQSFFDFELIVVDDGSTDGTRQALAGVDQRLRYVWQENAGVAAARNRGLELARAPIVAFLDSDNRWMPDHLAVVVEMLNRAPEAVLATTCPDFIFGGAGSPRDAELRDLRGCVTACGRLAGFISCVAVRREALAAIDGFDERLRAYEDDDLQIRLGMLGSFALLRRRTVVRLKPRDSLRDHGQRAGDYLLGAELSAENLLMAAERAPDGWRVELRRQAQGAVHLARAMTALEQGDGETTIATELAAAARLLPPCDQARLVANRIRVHLTRGSERESRLEAMRTVIRLWPDRRSDTVRYLRLLAVACALRLGRLREAMRLAGGWPWRGSHRALARIAPIIGQRTRRALEDWMRPHPDRPPSADSGSPTARGRLKVPTGP